jgi:hypothetical protein
MLEASLIFLAWALAAGLLVVGVRAFYEHRVAVRAARRSRRRGGWIV